MAFDVDFAHVPGNLQIPTIPTTIPNGFSETSKVLTDKITSDPGSLFQNPMTTSANFLGDSVYRLQDQLTGIADGSVFNPSITQGQAADYLATNPLEDVRTSMGNFMMHTGRLSGLLKSQGINAPGLQEILSVGTQMQNMMTLLNAGKGCLPIIGGATGLFSQDAFNGFTQQVDGIVARIARGAATIADIASMLVGVADLIRGIMDKDSLFLESCVNQLQAAAVGLVLEALNANPCAHFLFETISNQNPGGLLNVLSTPLAAPFSL